MNTLCLSLVIGFLLFYFYFLENYKILEKVLHRPCGGHEFIISDDSHNTKPAIFHLAPRSIFPKVPEGSYIDHIALVRELRLVPINLLFIIPPS